MGSLYHGTTQANLSYLLNNDDRFMVVNKLSLDATSIWRNPIFPKNRISFGIKAKDELVPDVCVYTEPLPAPDEEVDDDLITVSQMPDLAIEILSPTQSVGFLVRKIKAYFALGVKSCWLVIPVTKTINVYSQPNQNETFDLKDSEAVDKVMDIRLPIQKVFKNVFIRRSH
jgi:Uma2 family endonuclease